jgi:hypothetical protein
MNQNASQKLAVSHHEPIRKSVTPASLVRVRSACWLVVLLVGLSYCSKPRQSTAEDGGTSVIDRSESRDGGVHTSSLPMTRSLVQLIATPERYAGATVQATGFLELEHYGGALFLSREDWMMGLTNRVSVSLEPCASLGLGGPEGERPFPPSEELSHRYVVVRGQFKPLPDLGMGGIICSITRLDAIGPQRMPDAGAR